MADADFTIADVLEWARTKPADEEYDFTEAAVCALAQFGEATGRDYLVGIPSTRIDGFSSDLVPALVGDGANWTFGGLVTRLEALVPAPAAQSVWSRADAYLTDIELASA